MVAAARAALEEALKMRAADEGESAPQLKQLREAAAMWRPVTSFRWSYKEVREHWELDIGLVGWFDAECHRSCG